jgi:hypothetical protein
LSTDGKTATVTLAAPLTNEANVRVTTAGLLTSAGADVADYDALVYVSDNTAPTLKSNSYSYAGNLFTLSFSEPLSGTPTSLIKVFDSNNVDVTSSATLTAVDDKTITIGGLTQDQNYRVVMLGASDLAGNYFTGNKIELTFSTAKVDSVKPTVSSLEVRNNNTVRVVFAEAVSDLGDLKLDDAVTPVSTSIVTTATATGAAGEAIDVNGDGKTFDLTVSATGISGAAKVTLVNFVDLEGNTQDAAYNKLVTFAADTKAPVVTSTKVSGSKLLVTFDEAVNVKGTLASNDIQIVTPNNVLKDEYTKGIAVDTNDSTGKTVVVDFGTEVATAGTYTVKFASGVVTDKESTPNTQAYNWSVQFGGSADADKPTLYMTGTPATIDASAVVQSLDNKYIDVKFSEKMGNSALDTSNYLIDGVQAFSNAIFVGDTNVVRLTLKDGAVSVTGNHQVTVSGVKDLSGNANSVTTIENLKENTTIYTFNCKWNYISTYFLRRNY